jgi:ketosteroid isomerase-like protein
MKRDHYFSTSCWVAAAMALALLAFAGPLHAERGPVRHSDAADPRAHDLQASGQVADSAAVVATLESFHRALTEGDSAAALALLTHDARIVETGGIETKEEYRSHHLPSDIAFAQAMSSERGPMRVVVQGDVAWATSTSVARGEFRGRAVNAQNAELAVVVRTHDGWRISAIHWSSRNLSQ